MTVVSPDTRLPALHAEAGDPHTRLSQALANLEGAEWGLLLADQTALARQIAAQFGPGTLRVDARLGISREVFAAAGLAVATIDADWRGAVAIWLLEPDERFLKRAKRAEVPVLVDGTLAPGGGWLSQEAALIIYRDAATLSGFGDVHLTGMFGNGSVPQRRAPAPSDLSMAMILRDLATMPLRLARAARTTTTLMERFGGAAQPVGPTALLLAPDSAPDSHQPIGGVLAAARNVGMGTLITPGVQGLDAVLALLRGETQPAVQTTAAQISAPSQPQPAPSPINSAPTNTGPNATVQPASPQPQPAELTPVEPTPVQNDFVPEALNYVPEIVFSDSVPHQAPRSEVQTAQVLSEPEQAPTLALPDSNEPAPQSREDRPRREIRPRDKWKLRQEAQHISPQQSSPKAPPEAEPPEPDTEPHSSQAAPSSLPLKSQPQPEVQPELQLEVVLTPDLPAADGSSDLTEGFNEQQHAAYTRLRDWRNAEAKQLDISRFIVASNATLAAIARRAPQDEVQLREVRGMGPERVRKYGAAILAAVQAN